MCEEGVGRGEEGGDISVREWVRVEVGEGREGVRRGETCQRGRRRTRDILPVLTA